MSLYCNIQYPNGTNKAHTYIIYIYIAAGGDQKNDTTENQQYHMSRQLLPTTASQRVTMNNEKPKTHVDSNDISS